MADYASTHVIVRYGEVSDYSDNLLNRALTYDSTTATAPLGPVRLTATTSGVTVDLATFTAAETIAIKNIGSVDVEVRWTSLAPVTGSTANKQLLNAGRLLTLPSATLANDVVLITNSSSSECEVVAFGTINT
jgi:hypothetical protein